MVNHWLPDRIELRGLSERKGDPCRISSNLSCGKARGSQEVWSRSEGSLLRRTETVSLDPDKEARDAPPPEAEHAEAPAAPAAQRPRPDFDKLRVDIQRNFAAHMNLGTPDDAPAAPQPSPQAAPAQPEPERFVVTPKAPRRRMENLRAEAQKNTTVKYERRRPLGGLRITPSRIVLLVVALVAGGIAAYLATQHEPIPAPEPVQAAVVEPAPVLTEHVLVAKQTIAIGQKLTPSSIGWEDWPKSAMQAEYLTEAAAPTAMADVSGSVARSEILSGEPIRKAKLVAGGGGFLSAILDDGMRGVSVTVGADSSSGGFVVPNDHVDVVLTRSNAGSQTSQTILTDVRVLGINTKHGPASPAPAPAAGSSAPDPSTEAFTGQAIATLALDPRQAEVIIDAANMSGAKLSLVLRPAGETQEAGTVDERTANAAIRLTSPFWAK